MEARSVSGPSVLCVGETMALVTPTEPVPLADGDLFRLAIGGAESNVALYLSDLGHHTAWASRLGDDPLGRRVLDAIAAGGVDTRYVRRDKDAPTGVYFKDPAPERTSVYYYRSTSAASRMSPEDLDALPLDDVDLIHASGITAALSASCRDMLDALLRRPRPDGTLLSFDVNYRPRLWSAQQAGPVLLELSRRADIVFVGQDEASVLWGAETPDAVAELLGTVGTVVIKDADNGATEYVRGAATFVPALRVDVVEVVGAGDSFAAGYLSGLLRGLPSRQRLRLGHATAAWTLRSTVDYVPLADTAWLERLVAVSDDAWSAVNAVDVAMAG